MLSARADPFRQKSRLAISLSWVGGYTNVVVLLSMGTVVSHVTGTVTQLGRGIGQGSFGRGPVLRIPDWLLHAGAVLLGSPDGDAKRRGWRSKYILPVGLEALLLCCWRFTWRMRPLIGRPAAVRGGGAGVGRDGAAECNHHAKSRALSFARRT